MTEIDPTQATRPQRSHKDAVGSLVFFLTTMILVNAAITQWVAYRLNYHAALGRSYGGVYQPFAWFEWQQWYDRAPNTFNVAFLVLLGTFLLTVVSILIRRALRNRSSMRHDALHGTAHWATRAEIEATGLLPRDGAPGAGVYVGGYTDPETGNLYYLRHDGPEHAASIAPTRSGKGVGQVIPTCLSWPHSAVINDPKGELYNLTSGWRAGEGGNYVLKFDPAADVAAGGETVQFNPLDEIRLGTPREVADAMNLVIIVVDPDGKGLETHWQKTSFALLVGLVLHVLYTARAQGRAGCLRDVDLALADPSRDVNELYREMLANKHDQANVYELDGVHPTIASAARDMLDRPEEERGSVLSTAKSYLALYRDPIISRNTARSDFRLSDLMNAEKPVTLYLVTRDEDRDRMRPLVRLMLNQILRVLLRPELKFVDGRPLRPHKHRLLALLDEFPTYGKLEVLEAGLHFIAGYGIKVYLVMQDIAQLYKHYGREENVLAGCHVRAAYAPNKLETAKWLSEMCGQTTASVQQITESGKRFGLTLESVSRTYSSVARPLLTADEAMRLRGAVKDRNGQITEAGEVLVSVAGHAPIRGTQILYFLDPVFLERSKLPPVASHRFTPAAAQPTPKKGAPIGTIWNGASAPKPGPGTQESAP